MADSLPPLRVQAGQANLVEPVNHIAHGVLIGLHQLGDHQNPSRRPKPEASRPALGGCPRVGAAPAARRETVPGSGSATEAATGVRRPAAGHAGAPAARPAPRGARRAGLGVPLHRLERDTRDEATAGAPWVRRPGPRKHKVDAPPKRPRDDAPLGEHRAWRDQRRRQCSARIHVEHTNAEYRQWRPPQRYTGRRETFPETHLAIASPVLDRSAKRSIRRRASTELVLVRPAAC
jgi:hypothetical protein